MHACMHADLCGHRLVQTKETTKKELTKMGEMGWWTWCADLLCVGVMQMSGRKEKRKKKKLTCQMGWGWWTRALRVRMRCVLCCMRTCWLADVLPADTDEYKRKRKNTYLDADVLRAVLRADMLAC